MPAKYPTVTVYRSPIVEEQQRKSFLGAITERVVTGATWRWNIRATNGKIVADSAEGYNRRRWCLRGAEVALGLKGLQHMQPGSDKLVRRSGGYVRVVVEGGAA